MKKIISKIIMTVLLAIVLLSGSILASANEETARITVEDVNGNPGDTVKVNIGLENLPESYVSGAQFRVSYDADILELLSVDEFCGILTGGGQGVHDLKANPYIISYGDGINVINSETAGTIATFTFSISEEAEENSTTEITVTCDQIISASELADEIPVEAETATGTVTIKKSILHEHEFGEWEITKQATCTEEGIRTHACKECGYEESESVEKSEHVLSDWIVRKDATCTESGLKVKICKNCEEVFAEETIQPKGHVPSTDIIDEPTCEEKGRSQTICTVCEAVISEDSIPANGHTAGDWVVEREATCTEDGLRAKYCTVCNEIIESEITEAALGHTEGEWTVETEPTCDTEGEKVLTCSRCGDVIDVRYIEPLGHSYGEWTIVREASSEDEGLEERTCAVCGNVDKKVIPKTGHEECDHVFDGREEIIIDPSCIEVGTKRIYCSVEGCDAYVEETIPAAGHGEGEWTTTKESTCTEDGEEELLCEFCGEKLGTRKKTALGHDYGDWTVSKEPTCTERGERSKTCSRCEQEVSEFIAPTGHAYGEWEVTKEATCTEAGKREHSCEKCGISETEIISATGHQEGEWVTEKEATCQENGKKVKKCSACQEILETEVIAKKEHPVETWAILKEATCQTEGNRAGICTECGATVTQVIPKTGHIAGDEPDVISEPTCEQDGEKENHCKFCGESMGTEVIPAMGHDYGEPAVIKEPTCTEAGEQVQTCSRCGEERHTEISPAGHSYGEPAVTETATYSKDGSAVRTCEVCGDQLTIVIPRIDTPHEHDYTGVKETVKKATCTSMGEIHIHCADPLCDSYETEEIPKLQHQYGGWTVTKKATYSAKGTKQRTCKLCKNVEKASVPALTRTSISKAKVTCPAAKVYTGKAIAPVPAVKIGSKTLKKGTDFSLSYKNNKNVGVATIIVTGKGAYKDTIKKTFKINPKGTTISKLTRGTKQLTVTWKKQAAQTTGYQIQYSSRSDFKTQKIVQVSNPKTVSKKISNLAKKRKYYVRIRTYKMVGNKKYYSSWSAKKTVTTK